MDSERDQQIDSLWKVKLKQIDSETDQQIDSLMESQTETNGQ